MTEITPERSAILLADVSGFIGSCKLLPAWPEEWAPGQLAAILAESRKGDDFIFWLRRIKQAIEAAPPLLTVRTERKPPGSPWIRGRLPKPWGYDAYGQTTFTEAKALERHYIGRAAAVAWLHGIDHEPSDHLRAWLGPAWQKVGAGNTAPAPTHDLPGIPSGEIIEGFRLKPAEKWKDKLGHINKAANHYTKPFKDGLSALVQRGGPGKGSHTWNPARFAVRLIEDEGDRAYAARRASIKNHWEDWLPEFDALMEEKGFSHSL